MQRIARVSITLILIFTLGLTGVMGFFMLSVMGMGDLPDIQPPLTSTFYYRGGEVLTTRFEQNRFEVPLDRMPEHLVEAFIAVEDHRFYDHFGIDLQGLGRAVVRNVRRRRLSEGGSTITQQLARLLFLTQEKTFSRKIEEAMLTLQLERKYSKEEILEKYLNTIYFGHSAYGVEAAARTFFGKTVSELTLAESAMLAGVPRGPAYYSPLINLESAKARQAVVLARMADEKYITRGEKEEAAAEELVLRDRDSLRGQQSVGAYFVDYLIQRELAALFPDDPQAVTRGGLHIYTTLDKGMQSAAEAATSTLAVSFTDSKNVRQPQVALVAVDPQTGAVRALVGGRDFRENQYNRAIPPLSDKLRGRSPGSAFKPFVYAAALEAGYTPSLIQVSEPVTYSIAGQPDYTPSEYGGKYYNRPLTMREALAVSSNVAAVKTHMEIGPAKTADMARRLGIVSPLNSFASQALGSSNVTPLEMALAYAPFANQGIRVEPLFIDRITDAHGRVLYESKPAKTPALDPRIAYQITDMLKEVLRTGTGAGIRPRLDRPAAAKTGTSDKHLDSYIVGYTPDLVAAVWVGNDGSTTLGWGETGARLAGPIWARFMSEAHKGKEAMDFPKPEGLIAADICPETGLLHNPACSLTPQREHYIAGTEPVEMCRWPACSKCPPERQWHWTDWWFKQR